MLVALIAGAVGFYTARPKRDSIIVEASDHAVAVVQRSLGRLEDEMTGCYERIAVLEAEVAGEMVRADRAERQIKALSRELKRLGGDPTHILRDVR